ncbi:MAG: DegT/DnrJ/EryC1/StrS family aminotransferase [Gemmatimonadaceae bacterium]
MVRLDAGCVSACYWDRDCGVKARSRREIHNERCLALGGDGPPASLFPAGRVRRYTSGRQALLALSKALQLDSKSVVLLPAFVPEGVHAPYVAIGATIRLYPVDDALDPVWEALESELKERAVCVAVLIHYFGMTKPAERFRGLCDRYGALMIEDLAHVLSSGDESIGATGEYVLYSLPKVIGVPDGAVIVSRHECSTKVPWPVFRDYRLVPYLAATTLNLLASTLSRCVVRSPFERLSRRGLTYVTQSYRLLMSFFHRPTAMSRLAELLLERTPWLSIVQHRRELEAIYAQRLDPAAFRRFPYRSDSTHASMGYAVRVCDRTSLVSFLAERAMYGTFFEYKWNYFPDGKEHEAGRRVMREHFLFPTAYSLTVAEVEAVADAANVWARQSEQASNAGGGTA